MLYRSLLITGYVLIISAGYPQCLQDISFNDFHREGDPSAEWVIENDTSLFQGNEPASVIPTFFVSNSAIINARIFVQAEVLDVYDDDFIGFVFDYKKPNSQAGLTEYDFYLLDWKGNDESFNNMYAEEGFTLSRIHGTVPDNQKFNTFWRHNNYSSNDVIEILGKKHGDEYGWNPYASYNFEISYTSSRLVIAMEGDTIFDLEGCFTPGRFGFYTFSQKFVKFRNCRIEHASSFTLSNKSVCTGNQVQAFLDDPDCPGGVTGVYDWEWDFGDGTGSLDINPIHSYNVPGKYVIRLITFNELLCADTSQLKVMVYPFPEIHLGPDTMVGFNSSVTIDAGSEPGATYLWSTGEKGPVVTITGLTNDSLISVTKSLNGCDSYDEKLIKVEEPPVVPESRIYTPNAFSPNGDQLNDIFKPLIYNASVLEYEIKIFDRWGKVLFYSEKIEDGWDGMANGKICPEGLYVFRILYSISPESQSIAGTNQIQGTVFLTR